MRLIQIALVGAEGKMGKEIQKSFSKEAQFKIAAKVGRKNPLSDVNPAKIDMVIDFSSVEGFRESLRFCETNQIPLICGVTGLNKDDFALMKKASKSCAIFWAANMSLGIAVLKKAMSGFPMLSNFKFQIVEAHHMRKKDKPSGTALVLQEHLEKTLKRKVDAPISIREGDIIGVHQIIAYSEEEMLFFEHRAFSRALFAKGVVYIAKWIHTHSNGFYQMDDFVDEVIA